MKFLAFVFSVLAIFTSFANASVTLVPLKNTDKNVSDFGCVGRITNILGGSVGSATIVGDGSFIITARHITTLNGTSTELPLPPVGFYFSLEDKHCPIEEIYVHPYADIAIMKLQKTFPNPAKISFPDMIGKEFYGVGLGRSSTQPNIHNINWDIEYGTKRIFKNKIDFDIWTYQIKGTEKQLRRELFFILDEPPTLYKNTYAIDGEGLHGPGDSGGGIFIVENEEIKLVAVITAIKLSDPLIGILADLSACHEWIISIIKTNVDEMEIKKEDPLQIDKNKQNFVVNNLFILEKRRKMSIRTKNVLPI